MKQDYLHPDLQHQQIPKNRQCMVHIYWPTNDQLLFSAAFIHTNLKRPLEANPKEVKDHQNAQIAMKTISFL